MTFGSKKLIAPVAAAGVALALSAGACLAQDAAALARAAQNPIADLVSVPIQWNINPNVGPLKETQHVVNFQPVLPFKVNLDWNLIARAIVPVISAPVPVGDRTNGIGDVQLSAFLSPSSPSEWIWGAGMVGQAPTASNDVLCQGKWAIGPTAVALHIAKGDPRV